MSRAIEESGFQLWKLRNYFCLRQFIAVVYKSSHKNKFLDKKTKWLFTEIYSNLYCSQLLLCSFSFPL